MATLDGYNPYPTGLTAAQCVTSLKRGWNLPDTLANYAYIAKTPTPPTLEDVKTHGEFWLCTVTGKLYRAMLNADDNVLIWLEV